ncbi:HAMP domain-containing protein [Bacillus sp. RG28]|uniref:histidine kinase n=1 Tax=Gottfriedia endophytica TaxID=2820819 RepID=A0A940NRM5_9BACI|nr:ATP-binding protein [Gottfriedia endophytica]MBP0725591.1 HAMP domain-containing protein [Gottfriedia endophytica]
MKRIVTGLSFLQKLWLTICFIVLCTVLFFFLMFQFAYKQLYVSYVQTTLINEGKGLVERYHNLGDNKKFIEFLNSYDKVSNASVLYISNPRDLSACLPYNVHHESFITEDDRETLLKDKVISKTGYVDRFKRNIVGVVVPILKGENLEGIIYLSVPLKSITELVNQSKWLLVFSTFFFSTIVLLIGRRIIQQMIKPLSKMEQISYKMAKGDYSERMTSITGDEIGKLALAFNSMSDSLQREDENRKDFLANVSHELRTPLSYVSGYSEAILDGVVKEDELKHYVGIIHSEASRMQRLVRDLLDLASLEGEQFPLQKAPNVLSQIIEEAITPYLNSLKEKQITVIKNIDDSIIANLDADRFSQVIHNVISNAIRYSPIGKSIYVTLKETDSIYIEIQDEGKGVPKEQIEHLGERFHRVEQARSRKEGGTGLGLAIAKQIVELHDGKILFTSEPNHGLKVLIILPIFE